MRSGSAVAMSVVHFCRKGDKDVAYANEDINSARILHCKILVHDTDVGRYRMSLSKNFCLMQTSKLMSRFYNS